MKAIDIEGHFPWYVDSSDTDNLDSAINAMESLAGQLT